MSVGFPGSAGGTGVDSLGTTENRVSISESDAHGDASTASPPLESIQLSHSATPSHSSTSLQN